MRPSVDRIQVRHWLLVGVLVVAAALWARPRVWGVALGGAVIGLSTFLYALGFLTLLRRQSRGLAFGILFVKVALFLGLGWLVFEASGAYRPDPVGFALGVSCMPAAAVWEAVRVRKD
jgi:hypothetical protein